MVGGWLSRGNLALESKAHFLAVAEHRPCPQLGLENVSTQLRKGSSFFSFGHLPVRTFTPGGHAGVGVSLHGRPTFSSPPFFDPSFKEFFSYRVVL